MKKIKLKTEVYDWTIIVISAFKKDAESVDREFRKIKMERDDANYYLKHMKKGDWGGVHYYNAGMHRSLVVLYNCNTQKKIDDVLFHEIRHTVDRILNICSVNDIEAAAFLTGYIHRKIMPHFYKLKK